MPTGRGPATFPISAISRAWSATWLALLVVSIASAQSTFYWDRNGSTAGPGTSLAGTWSTTGASNWSSNSDGTGATSNWISGNHAVFSAGTTATGAFTVTVSGTQNVGNLTFEEGTVTLSGGTLNFNAATTTVSVASGLTASATSVLAGAATFNKEGAGTFVTGGASANTHTGAININAGIFEIAKTAFVGAINNNANVSIASGATLRLNGASTYTQETIGNLSGAGTVTNVGAASVNFVISGGSNTTFSGTITDGTNSLNLVKNTGAGTLTLSGANSYDGTTTITTGAINLQNASALGTTAGGTTVSSGAALQLEGGIAVGAEALTLNGTGIGSSGALRNISGANSYAGAITLASATEVQSDAGTLTLSGTISGATFGLTFDGAGNTTVTGAIGTTTGGVTKSGTGTLTLSGANTYTGTTAVNAGLLQLGASNVISDSSALTVASGATFDLNGFSDTVASLAGAGTVDLGGGGALTTAGNTSTTFSGVLVGDGTFTKQGTGALTLDSTTDFNFSGTFTLGGGTLRLSDLALTLGTLNITADSIIDFTGVSSLNVGTLSISSGVNLTIQNWANASDFFFTQLWTGAAYDTTGVAPMSQITFNGFTANDTKWLGYEDNAGSGYHQITPVPEPSTYGALLLTATGGLLAWRRRRLSRRAA